MDKPLVSVIIPTYNSSNTLSACLRSIRNQTYKNVEVIIVDRFSADETGKFAQLLDIKVIKDDSIRSKARNIAAKKSKGDFLLSVDSDMVLTEKVIEECVAKSKEADSIIIPEISFGIGFWSKCKALEKQCYIGDDTIEAARFFSRKAFESVGGYDSSLEFAEDWDIHQRIKNAGFKVARIKSLIRHNDGSFVLWKTMKKKYQYGKTLGGYKKKHPKEFSKQSKLIRPAFLRNWRLLAENPIIGAGMLFMKGCEFIAVGVGAITPKNQDYQRTAQFLNSSKLPFVSFVIPTYNAERYLEKCLESIEMQNYPKDKLEVLVADGCSKDNTLEIAKKYGAKVLFNAKRDAESGKSIGIAHSKGQIVAFVDSDNEIASTDWLSRMVTPLMLDKTIAGVESQYLIRDDFSILNRYCARMKIVDPVARLLASEPSTKDNGLYLTLNYKANSNPVIGANGFLWRKSVISSINGNSSKFEESNFASKAVRNGFTKYAAIPNVGIYHYYADNFGEFVEKRAKIGNKVMIRKTEGRTSWLNNVGGIKFILATVYCATIIGPMLESFYQFAKTRDISWFLHPVISFTTVAVYGKVYLQNKMDDLNDGK